MLGAHNPNRKPNSDVVKRCVNGLDITRKPRNVWLIDFGTDMSLEEAAQYEMPFEYVKTHVYPVRKDNNRKSYREWWWIHAEPRPSMRKALSHVQRYIVTLHVAKHRVFVWLDNNVIPDHELVVFAREDDYFFGVLHSRVHELWSLRQGTSLEDRPRYTPTTCFETFPFPWPPGQEPSRGEAVAQNTESKRVATTSGNSIDRTSLATASQLQHEQAIAQAARELVQLREAWLNPAPYSNPHPGPLPERERENAPLALAASRPAAARTREGREAGSEGEKKSRTLTNLYNARPTWLDNAHRKLDEAVCAAYGWPANLSDDDILARLLALNLKRAG